jgi:hypothetical protein
VDEQHREAQPEREDDADRGVALAGSLAENAEQNGGKCTANQRADADVESGQQRESGSRQGQLTRAMHREGHLAHDDEGTDEASHKREQGGCEQRLLDEVAAQQIHRDVEGE